MDNDHSICQRLAMMLDEDPSCTILIIGRYMAPVRAEYNSVRHLVRKAKLRPTIANNGHLRSVTAQQGRLEAFPSVRPVAVAPAPCCMSASAMSTSTWCLTRSACPERSFTRRWVCDCLAGGVGECGFADRCR